MREQFEKAFPDKSIFEYVDYDRESGMYGSKEHVSRQELIGLFAAIANLNGAWWAWSYQQKKIDALLDHTCGTYEGWQGGVLIGEEYDSLKGTKEFFDALQEKLENRPIDQT